MAQSSKVFARQGFVEIPGSRATSRHFHKTLPRGNLHHSAPQIGIETNDGDSESRERGLQADVSINVTECDGYVE